MTTANQSSTSSRSFSAAIRQGTGLVRRPSLTEFIAHKQPHTDRKNPVSPEVLCKRDSHVDGLSLKSAIESALTVLKYDATQSSGAGAAIRAC